MVATQTTRLAHTTATRQQLKKLESRPVVMYAGSSPQTNTLAKVQGRNPRDASYITEGDQEGQSVTGRKPGKDLVITNQRPSNGGCWRVNGRSFTEKHHVGVQAVGENHSRAGY